MQFMTIFKTSAWSGLSSSSRREYSRLLCNLLLQAIFMM